ncbi:MAG: hypothetical protein F4Y03_17110 [Alphaproteobacteria bacterium]|nr:hypothetical protein [Alphaproteobacteria bacterium]
MMDGAQPPTVSDTPIRIFGERHPYGCTSRWARDGAEADCATLLRVGDWIHEHEGSACFRVTGFRDGKALLEAA